MSSASGRKVGIFEPSVGSKSATSAHRSQSCAGLGLIEATCGWEVAKRSDGARMGVSNLPSHVVATQKILQLAFERLRHFPRLKPGSGRRAAQHAQAGSRREARIAPTPMKTDTRSVTIGRVRPRVNGNRFGASMTLGVVCRHEPCCRCQSRLIVLARLHLCTSVGPS